MDIEIKTEVDLRIEKEKKVIIGPKKIIEVEDVKKNRKKKLNRDDNLESNKVRIVKGLVINKSI